MTAGSRLLVADDDQAVRDSLERVLRFEGYVVELAVDGADTLLRARANPPDLMVLDVMMPGVSGIEACRSLRAVGARTPILMLTARDDVGDRVAGLDAGADDYLVKPFALQELLARLRALLRRATPPGRHHADRLTMADLVLDPHARQVRRGGTSIDLTRTEFNLLHALLTNAGRVLTRSYLFQQVWGYDLEGSSNSLDVYIGYLRRKLEAHGAPRIIQTVRGVGYVARPGGAP